MFDLLAAVQEAGGSPYAEQTKRYWSCEKFLEEGSFERLSKPGQYSCKTGLKVKVKMYVLEKENVIWTTFCQITGGVFWNLFYAQKDRLKTTLDVLASCLQLPRPGVPVYPYFQANHKVTPVNALKQLAELEGPVINFIILQASPDIHEV